jgi:methylated-DNA-[protein]-cysteine S-methyltransferase
MERRVDWIQSPIGLLKLVSEGGQVCGLSFPEGEQGLVRGGTPGSACGAIEAYFRGELTAIDAIEVKLEGTPFQKRVWAELRRIPAGTTISYKELAARIGRPAATRAVGLANGANPIAIVVPCHRVIGANGALTGYGGGLDRKRWLLAHERGAAALEHASGVTRRG